MRTPARILFCLLFTLHLLGFSSGHAQDLENTEANDQEVRLSVQPGLLTAFKKPIGYSSPKFSLGAQLTYFIIPHLGVIVPYQYTKHSVSTSHQTGFGLDYRFLDLKGFQGEIYSNWLYHRLEGRNRQGYAAGIYAQYQWNRSGFFQPAIGPFFVMQHTLLPGKDLVTGTVGLALHLSGHSDFDL